MGVYQAKLHRKDYIVSQVSSVPAREKCIIHNYFTDLTGRIFL